LPQLAWIAKINRENLRVSAIVGDNIEYGQDFLVAGVWDGPFKDGAFENTDAFFGTGPIARGRSVILALNAGISEAIYYHVGKAGVIASNSLPLLLAGIDNRLDARFAFYPRITESIHSGIDAYEKIIPTEQGQVISQTGSHNIGYNNGVFGSSPIFGSPPGDAPPLNSK
jgi:hypothetical protein